MKFYGGVKVTISIPLHKNVPPSIRAHLAPQGPSRLQPGIEGPRGPQAPGS